MKQCIFNIDHWIQYSVPFNFCLYLMGENAPLSFVTVSLSITWGNITCTGPFDWHAEVSNDNTWLIFNQYKDLFHSLAFVRIIDLAIVSPGCPGLMLKLGYTVILKVYATAVMTRVVRYRTRGEVVVIKTRLYI